MIKICYLMRRLPSLSREEFQSYWSEKHPQAAPEDAFAALGVKRYVQVLPLETEARDLVVGPRTGLIEPFDGIAELWVDSLEALERNWSTDKAREYVQIFFEDEQNFIDWTRSTILVSNEYVVIP
ncbi:EthD domain-containing protein [bacterium]|nr:EthD domain-containing protein [bacterium]